jgi:hypothetical protein
MTSRTRRGEELKGRRGVVDLAVSTFVLLLVVVMTLACGPNEGVLRSGMETPPVNSSDSNKTSALTISDEIQSMRTADFKFIMVIRRKDGGKLDTDDRNIIKTATVDMNRRVSSDEGRAIVIGSNFALAADKMSALTGRFSIEDYSTPAVDANRNAPLNK